MRNHSFLRKVSLAAAPAVFVILVSLGVETALACASPAIRIALYPILGTLGAFLIYRFVSWSSDKLQVQGVPLGNCKSLMKGIAVGLFLSISSGTLFWATLAERPAVVPHVYFDRLPVQAWGNIGPGVIEEVGFRGGTAFLVAAFWGPLPALASGSIPFGLAHIASGLLGQPVTIAHVLGTTLAGLLLTLLFFRYGLLASIGCHWIWNALVGSWTKMLHIQGQAPAKIFEGSWTTIVVLGVASVVLLWGVEFERDSV